MVTSRADIRLLVLHSASAQDQELRDEILRHLRPRARSAGINLWYRDLIGPGEDVRRETERAIESASLALVLVSPDFLASDWIEDVELPKLRERYLAGPLRVLPVIIRSCAWESHSWLSELLPFPRAGGTLAALSKTDDERDRVLTMLADEAVALAAEISATPGLGEETRNGGIAARGPTQETAAEHESVITLDAGGGALAGYWAEQLSAFFKSEPCRQHDEPARPVVTGTGLYASFSVLCCCAPFADEVRLGLFYASGSNSFHVAVHGRDRAVPRWCLEDVLPRSRVRWAGLDEDVGVLVTNWYGPSLLRVQYIDHEGDEHEEYLDRSCEVSLDIIERGPFLFALGRHPSGVSRLFTDLDDLVRALRALRDKGRVQAMVEAYLAEIRWRLSPRFMTIKEEIEWEVFDSVQHVEEVLRRLERDVEPNRLKVAVVLDPEVDAQLFNTFVRKAKASPVKLQFRASDLMLATRFRRTVGLIQREIDRLPRNTSSERLELVAFDLAPEQPCWRPCEDVPCGYSGTERLAFGEIADPVFFLDVVNDGTREARIYAAYLEVRLRHIKPHGYAEPRLQRPITAIDLPLNGGGTTRYAEVQLPAPVLVPPGSHARIEVRLANAGGGWRGVVDVGLRYGDEHILRVPALSIFL